MSNKSHSALLLVPVLILCGGVIVAILAQSTEKISLSGEGGQAASACTASTTRVAIGHQEAKEILPDYARRAWAHISIQDRLGNTATNTIAVGLGETPSLTRGYELSTTTTELNFGLNTDLPFTGAVNVLTSTGSTTIDVVECRY